MGEGKDDCLITRKLKGSQCCDGPGFGNVPDVPTGAGDASDLKAVGRTPVDVEQWRAFACQRHDWLVGYQVKKPDDALLFGYQ